MRHMSFVLPPEEREGFRLLCGQWKLSPSEALRAMVQNALGAGYGYRVIKKRAQR